jgi:hypothetical protein
VFLFAANKPLHMQESCFKGGKKKSFEHIFLHMLNINNMNLKQQHSSVSKFAVVAVAVLHMPRAGG